MGLPPTSRSMTLPGPHTLGRSAGPASAPSSPPPTTPLPALTLAYNTYGTLNAAGDNAIIVGHSLTSNSCVDEWWAELLGPGPSYLLDTSRYFVVCCNYLGSVYGSSSPLEEVAGGGVGSGSLGGSSGNHHHHSRDVSRPPNRRPYASSFPAATVRDNVRLQRQLLDALGVRRLAFAVGGSLGGMLALEWACTYPDYVGGLVIVAACARHTDWAIGLGEAGRQAIFADARWRGGEYYGTPEGPPLAGMSAARQLAMLSYRTPESFTEKFGRRERAAAAAAGSSGGGRTPEEARRQGAGGALPYYEVEGYLNYQGHKFIRRFDPLCYVRLTQLLDSHDVGQGREGGVEGVLRRLAQRTLVVGIDSDLLYPVSGFWERGGQEEGRGPCAAAATP
jgi:homoserine O-acetyltransferase